MAEKLDVYDLLAALVPGTLLVCLVAVMFPVASDCAFSVSLPGAFAVVALTVLSVFTGHMIQAFSSLVMGGTSLP